ADALAAANYDKEDWLGEVERLSARAGSVESTLAARVWLRIARIYRLEGITDAADGDALEKGGDHDPQNEQANLPLEAAYGAEKKFDDIVALHEKRASAGADQRQQGDLYRRFASMWAMRWNDLDRSADFYRKALQAYYGDGISQGATFPGHLAAFGFL